MNSTYKKDVSASDILYRKQFKAKRCVWCGKETKTKKTVYLTKRSAAGLVSREIGGITCDPCEKNLFNVVSKSLKIK